MTALLERALRALASHWDAAAVLAALSAAIWRLRARVSALESERTMYCRIWLGGKTWKVRAPDAAPSQAQPVAPPP